MDHAADAKRHRHMAEEMRAKAGIMSDHEVRSTYLRLADGYDLMADGDERLARNAAQIGDGNDSY